MASQSSTMSTLTTYLARRPLEASISAAVAASFLAWAVRDYRAYIALGPGGVPHNFGGWLMVTLGIRPFALSKRSATSTDGFPDEGYHRDVKALPERKGERARLGGIVPHRQLSQHAPETMREFIQNLFANAQSQNPTLLETKKSLYERMNPALFVAPKVLASGSVPAAAETARGEIGHHHGDLSIHLYLDPADAKLVIDKRWAERHRLSLPSTARFANRFHVADGYVMIYGPRNEDEMEVLATILRNAVRFMTGREDVEAIEWRQRIV